MRRHLVAFAGVVVSAVSLIACSQDGAGPTGKAVVRVNGHEITAHQIDYALAHFSGNGAAIRMTARSIAEQYVDQQLLLDKALESNLQREATVVEALEEARRQILADAYLERALGFVVPPTKEEIRTFYRSHPELFGERKVYELLQISVAKSLPIAELEKRVERGTEPQELIAWLESRRAFMGIRGEILPAEKIDSGVLARLQGMKRGGQFIWSGRDEPTVVVLADAWKRPISERQATASIEQHLFTQKQLAIRSEVLMNLRQQARIEWTEAQNEPSSVIADARPESLVRIGQWESKSQ